MGTTYRAYSGSRSSGPSRSFYVYRTYPRRSRSNPRFYFTAGVTGTFKHEGSGTTDNWVQDSETGVTTHCVEDWTDQVIPGKTTVSGSVAMRPWEASRVRVDVDAGLPGGDPYEAVMERTYSGCPGRRTVPLDESNALLPDLVTASVDAAFLRRRYGRSFEFHIDTDRLAEYPNVRTREETRTYGFAWKLRFTRVR